MKITRKNIREEYPKISQSILPPALKENEYEEFLEALETYGRDTSIDEWVDLFISKLNDVLEKNNDSELEPEVKKATQKTATKQKKASQKDFIIINRKKYYNAKIEDVNNDDIDFNSKISITQSDYNKLVEFMKNPFSNWLKDEKGKLYAVGQKSDNFAIFKHINDKTNKTKKANKKENKTNVNKIDLGVQIIRSFYNLLDKEIPEIKILNLYRKIEKAALEHTLRKTDENAKLIEEISEILANAYNKKRTKISYNNKEELYQIAYGYVQMQSVRLLKSFVNLIGNENTDKLEKLKSKLEQVPENDKYYKQSQKAIKQIDLFVEKKYALEADESILTGYKWKPNKELGHLKKKVKY